MKPRRSYQPDQLRRRLEALLVGVHPEQMAALQNALNLAFRAHAGQTRDDGSPYVQHPLRVASLLVEEMDVRDLKTLCAALLHDVVEDSATITLDEIAAECSPTVAELVRVLTKPPKQGRTHAEINAAYFPRIAEYPDETVRYIKLADRLDNVRDLVNCPEKSKRDRMLTETQTFYRDLIESVKDQRLKKAFKHAFGRAIDRVKTAFP
jgi:guanosine-3',5'-bis(diphosphate) 3'-pyrophosphohydrolase